MFVWVWVTLSMTGQRSKLTGYPCPIGGTQPVSITFLTSLMTPARGDRYIYVPRYSLIALPLLLQYVSGNNQKSFVFDKVFSDNRMKFRRW